MFPKMSHFRQCSSSPCMCWAAWHTATAFHFCIFQR